jgi:hypothetical protein
MIDKNHIVGKESLFSAFCDTGRYPPSSKRTTSAKEIGSFQTFFTLPVRRTDM